MKRVAILTLISCLAGCADNEPAMPAISPGYFIHEVTKNRERPVGVLGTLNFASSGYTISDDENSIPISVSIDDCLNSLVGEVATIVFSPLDSFDEDIGHITSFIMAIESAEMRINTGRTTCIGEKNYPGD